MYTPFLDTFRIGVACQSCMVDTNAASCLYPLFLDVHIVSFQIINTGKAESISYRKNFVDVLDNKNTFAWNNKTQKVYKAKISRSTVWNTYAKYITDKITVNLGLSLAHPNKNIKQETSHAF